MTPEKDPALEMLRQIMAADGLSFEHLARSIEESSIGPSLKKVRGARPAHPALPVLERLEAKKGLTPADRRVVRAVILPYIRPAFDIKNDDFESLPQEWNSIDQQRPVMRNLIRAVGRIDITESQSVSRPVGTAFLVGRGMIMTNRHVAELFTSGTWDEMNVRFPEGHHPCIDLKQEVDIPDSIVLHITAPILIHPSLDVALLKIDNPPSGLRPLRLAQSEPETLSQRIISVIGYPAFNPNTGDEDKQHQIRIFRNIFDKKRLLPGRIMTPSRSYVVDQYCNTVRALRHDSSTLYNNSGSAVIDIASGLVIGLHFQGEYLEANYALPAWELAADERIMDAGVLPA